MENYKKMGQYISPLNEGDLAKQSGLARETVNRNIQAYKTAALLSVTNTGLVVKDIKKLESLLDTNL